MLSVVLFAMLCLGVSGAVLLLKAYFGFRLYFSMGLNISVALVA